SSTDMGGTTRTLSYLYDRDGDRTRITHPDGTFFASRYDGLDRQYYLLASDTLGIVYHYFAPEGMVGTRNRAGIATWFGYDGLQRPNYTAHPAYAASTDVAYVYSPNAAGQIGWASRANDPHAWPRRESAQ